MTADPDALATIEAARRLRTDAARADAIARQHALGKMSARERLAELLDPDSLEETGALVEPGRHSVDTEDLVAPGDGVVAGFGRIAARPVGVIAFDFTIVGGSNGENGEWKILRVLEQCERQGMALVMLLDGGGHRIQEGLDSRHFARGTTVFQRFANLSGWIPMVAAIMGPGFAGPSNFAALADFVVMVEGTSTMGIAGPALVRAATGQALTKDELGSAAIQATAAGICDLAAPDDRAALAAIRRFLSFLPSNAGQPAPMAPPQPATPGAEAALATLVPANPRRAYDMRKLVAGIADDGSVMELRPTHACNILTVLARIDGRPVGIVANQPLHMGGALTTPACEKGAHFVSLCDAFGLPLVYLVDVPGFLVGPSAEATGLARRSGRLLFELGQATVPRASVVVRKGYGLAYIAMGGGRSFGAELCVAWPGAEICAMSVEGAVDVAYRRKLDAAPDPAAARASLIGRFRAQLGPLKAAEAYGIDDVIDPVSTRAALARAFARAPARRPPHNPRRLHAISPI